MLAMLSGTNYAFNEQIDGGQYGPYAISSESIINLIFLKVLWISISSLLNNYFDELVWH